MTRRITRSTKAPQVQRRSDGEKKDMGQTSGNTANDDKRTHVSDRKLDKDDTSKFQPIGAPTEQYVSRSESTQREHRKEEEQMESDHGFDKKLFTANAPSEVANQDSMEITEDSTPI